MNVDWGDAESRLTDRVSVLFGRQSGAYPSGNSLLVRRTSESVVTDLTGFGPYYGDAWSDLDQFEASLARVRDEEAAWYVTFHQKGVIERRSASLHVDRMLARGEVREVEPGRFQRLGRGAEA